jgi:hypothetical protein
MDEYFLLHLQVEKRTDFPFNQQKANDDGEKLYELLLLFASSLLLNAEQVVPHAVLEHLVEGSLVVELHLHRFHSLQPRHLHVYAHHHFVQILPIIVRLL